jgi:hypothetical protein
MTKVAADTRSIVIEREMPHPPEKIWRALTQAPLIEEWLMKNDFQPVVGLAVGDAVRMEQSGFRPEEGANYQGANYGWQKFIGGLERVAAGLD